MPSQLARRKGIPTVAVALPDAPIAAVDYVLGAVAARSRARLHRLPLSGGSEPSSSSTSIFTFQPPSPGTTWTLFFIGLPPFSFQVWQREDALSCQPAALRGARPNASARRVPSGSVSSGSSSSSGTRTKRRVVTSRCGRVRRSVLSSRSPRRSRSTSSGRGLWRGSVEGAAALGLDPLAGVEQRFGLEVGADADGGVEEVGLVEDLADRLGDVGGGDGVDLDPLGFEQLDRRAQVGGGVADVGAEAEVAGPLLGRHALVLGVLRPLRPRVPG